MHFLLHHPTPTQYPILLLDRSPTVPSCHHPTANLPYYLIYFPLALLFPPQPSSSLSVFSYSPYLLTFPAEISSHYCLPSTTSHPLMCYVHPLECLPYSPNRLFPSLSYVLFLSLFPLTPPTSYPSPMQSHLLPLYPSISVHRPIRSPNPNFCTPLSTSYPSSL